MLNLISILSLFQLVFSNLAPVKELYIEKKGFTNLTPVKELDLQKYEKRWFQIYGNKFDQTFQKYGNCITADYNILPNGNISVLNSEYSLTNKLEQISGYAYYKYNIKSKLNTGALTVRLDGVPHESPYWIVNLGPVINYQYDWAIVTDPFQLSLFVLVRDIDRFYRYYEQEILDILYGYGYDNIVIISHTNCKYVDE